MAEELLTASGSHLRWVNTSFGKSYFYIDVNEINLTDTQKPYLIDVNYSMSMKKELKGRILMKDAPIKNTLNMHNYFKPGDITLTDKTTVWLSKAVSKMMKNQETFTLDIDGDRKKTFTKFSKSVHTIVVKNHATLTELKIPIIHAETEAGSYIEMHDSKNSSNPMITKMVLSGLKLELQQLELRK